MIAGMATLINDPIRGRIINEIFDELDRSKTLHPYYPSDPLRRSAITLEEVLEALVEMSTRAVELQRTALHVGRLGNEEKRRGLDHLRKELIQSGALIVKQLEAMDSEPREEQ